METRLLRVLVELSRRGTMRAVADATGYGTSAVSQQIATLEREVGQTLIEPAGRRVRLTLAGRRLVEHAERILAEVESARGALACGAEPAGRLRVAAYATALSMDLLPIACDLASSHPGLRLELQEREPPEVMQLLADDEVDLGFVHDFNLVPQFVDDGATVRLLCEGAMVLAVPARRPAPAVIDAPARLRAFAESSWIANSRGDSDTELAQRVCALADFQPAVGHRVDSLGLVLEFVARDFGVALLPAFVSPVDGVRFVPITGVDVRRRMFAVTRPGREAWPAVALVTDLVAAHTSP